MAPFIGRPTLRKKLVIEGPIDDKKLFPMTLNSQKAFFSSDFFFVTKSYFGIVKIRLLGLNGIHKSQIKVSSMQNYKKHWLLKPQKH